MKRKKMLSVLLALCLVLPLGACNQKSEQDKLYDEQTQKDSSADIFPESVPEGEASSASGESKDASPTPEPTPYVDPEGLEGEFTVMAFKDDSLADNKDPVAALAEEFMKLHPGVTIHVEYATGKGNMTAQERKEQYKTRILAELGSGVADYLLFGPREELNLYGLSKSGIFLDLRPYFEGDPAINPDDYYTQVLDAMSVDGKFTLMPYSFSFEGAFLNRRLLEKLEVDLDSLKAVDYQMVLDWYDQAKAIEPEVQATFGALTKETFYNYESPAYIDLESSTANFTSQEFIEFLTRTGDLEESDRENMEYFDRTSATDPFVVEGAMEYWEKGAELDREFTPDFMETFFDNAHPGVAAVSGISAGEIGVAGNRFECLAGPYPFVSTKGQLQVDTTQDFSIPSSMKKPDLAWKFISYCIGEREDMKLSASIFTDRIPINRKNFVKQMEYIKTNSMIYAGAKWTSFDPKKNDSSLCAQKLDEFLAMPLVNSKTYVIDMSEYLTEFYDSKLTTPEQCAEKIQGRVDIWLHE